MREEFLELGRQLGGQGLVVRDDYRGTLHLLHDVRHREGLAAAGDAQQGLVIETLAHAGGQTLHGLFLIAHHAEIRYQLKVRHGTTSRL